MQRVNSAQCAHAYVSRYGMALVDIPPRSKVPAHGNWQKPGGYFTDASAAARHWQDRPDRNMGVVLGPSRLCSLDIDELEHSKAFFSSFGVDLEKWAQDYPTIQGKPGRFRILFRVPDDVTLKRHALNWPRQEDKRKKMCIFELRGGDVQDVLPPSIHPDTQQPYIWLNSLNGQVPLIPKLLLDMWMNWDITKRDGQAACPWAEKPTQQARAHKPRLNGNGSVIHAFNQAHSITDILAHHGYKQMGTRWLSPHSSTGMPGIHIFDNNTLFCHHGSDPLCSDHARDCFDVYRKLEHNGDVTEAVKAAAELLGLHQAPAQTYEDPPAYLVDIPDEQPTQSMQDEKPEQLVFEAEQITANFDFEALPPRRWLIKDYLIKGFVNVLISPGGIGKSTFALAEAIGIATGRTLTPGTRGAEGPAKALLVNNEENREELHRRIGAICKFHRINAEDLSNFYFFSGYGNPLLISITDPDGTIYQAPNVSALIDYITKNQIELLSIDPFISTHQSSENDNIAINQVMQTYCHIAAVTSCAIRLVHHTRKNDGDSEIHAGDEQAARGAKSLIDAARCSHTLARMNEKTAEDWNITDEDKIRMIRIDSAKNNFSLPDTKTTWLYLNSVKIGQPPGEWVGVPVQREIEEVGEKTEDQQGYGDHLQDFAAAVIRKLGGAGRVRWTEVRQHYMDISGLGRTAASDKVTSLPKGRDRSALIRIGTSEEMWRIWYEKNLSEKSPIYIILEMAN